MTELYSHPPEEDEGFVLEDHLHDVAERSRSILPADVTLPDGSDLSDVVARLGLVHDFGKATTWFQDHIGILADAPDQRFLRHHAPLGAYLAYDVFDRVGYSNETCLAGFVAVGKHHGAIPDTVEYVFDRTHPEYERSEQAPTLTEFQRAAKRQVPNVDEHAPAFASEIVAEASDGATTWDEFCDRIRDGSLFGRVRDDVATIGITPNPNPSALSSSFYGTVLQAWSTLVFADKTSAARAPHGDAAYAATTPTFQTLDEFVGALEDAAETETDRERHLNELRSEARNGVLSTIEDGGQPDGDVATLTLPTGMGKTLTGLSAATALRDRTDGERIIYALPFTSIIDQVADEIRDIYADERDGRLISIHHHLADTSIAVDDAETADADDRLAAMLGESWRAGLTVTTFVQLFESLVGPANSQSMKLPALHDSVIVLDEPQSLPPDWWKLVDRLVDLLTTRYDATVIAMTATQPEIFDEATELVPDPNRYFEEVERVRYRIDDSVHSFVAGDDDPLGYDAAGERIARSVADGNSVLAVCNTIDSARELLDSAVRDEWTALADVYESRLQSGSESKVDATELVERIEHGSPVVVHLTTRLRPVDRLTLIEATKKLTASGIPVLAITTQLIEAGVDVSFDQVYRDLAPMDSIVQAAGRCNRSFETDRGTVAVWRLGPTEGRESAPGTAVYDEQGPSLLSTTAATLEDVVGDDHEVPEREVARHAIRDYYRRLNEERDVGREEYVDYLDRAEAGKLGELSLIDGPRSVDLLVCRHPDDVETVEQIRDAFAHFDYERAQELLDETSDLRVSVPIYSEDSEEADVIRGLDRLGDRDVHVLKATPGSRHRSRYDPTTGFVVEDDSVEGRFL